MNLTIDVETRSEVDLKRAGSWVYAEHPSTEIICMALKEGNSKTYLWINDYFKQIYLDNLTEHLPLISYYEAITLINQSDTIEAHNVFFEKAIYENVLFDWPEIPEHKWRCSAAKASFYALPRALDDACQALGLSQRKDKEGYFVMMKMCKPRKPTKLNKAKWHEDPEDLLTLLKYCIQDVEAEYALSQALRDLSPKEQQIWSVDQIINKRGLYVDTKAAQAAIDLIAEYESRLLNEFKSITKTVNSPKQVAKTLDWLTTRGVKLRNLTKSTVSKVLEKDLPPDIRRALEIRQSLAKSSTAKFKQMVLGASSDSRMRDITMYSGASTGRWAGKRIQPHNMPRKMPDDFEEIIDLVKDRDLESFELLYGDPMQALSGSIRGFICAAPGYDLICADFSAIEGRVLAWLAEEDYIIQNYFDGKDPYIVFASQIFGINYQEIFTGVEVKNKKYDEMRFDGKTGELACGYQGGERAIKQFAPEMPIKRRKEIVRLWRSNRPMTVKFWKDMEAYAVSAVTTGLTYTWNKIKWGMNNNFLHCKLPSGHLLSYYKPLVEDKTKYAYIDKEGSIAWLDSPNKKGERLPERDFIKPTISFMGVDSETKKWKRQSTYGGKLAENIVQAVARDLLAEALVRLEAKSYPIVLHVHDEAISEVPKGEGSVKEFVNIMAATPGWAFGCPIGAEGFRTKRYKKG